MFVHRSGSLIGRFQKNMTNLVTHFVQQQLTEHVMKKSSEWSRSRRSSSSSSKQRVYGFDATGTWFPQILTFLYVDIMHNFITIFNTFTLPRRAKKILACPEFSLIIYQLSWWLLRHKPQTFWECIGLHFYPFFGISCHPLSTFTFCVKPMALQKTSIPTP